MARVAHLNADAMLTQCLVLTLMLTAPATLRSEDGVEEKRHLVEPQVDVAADETIP